MVSCTISEDKLICPYFLTTVLLLEAYKRMLRYYPLLQAAKYSADMISQQVGAPPRYTIPVQPHFVEKVAKRRMKWNRPNF